EWFTLKEESSFTKKKAYDLIIPAPVAGSPAKTTLTFRYKELTFDPATQNSPLSVERLRDGFELSLTGADGKSLVPSIGPVRDAFYYAGEELPASARAQGVNVRTEANGEVVVSLSVAGLAPGTAARLVARLVNDDGDTATEVKISAPTFTADAVAAPWTPLAVDPGAAPGAATLDWTVYAPVAAGYGILPVYSTASWTEKSTVLSVEAGLKNIAQSVRSGRHIVVLKGISDPSVRVLNADGLTTAGEPYFDFGAALTSNQLAAGQTSKLRTIQFYNPNGLVFTWSASVHAAPNNAPGWSSTPVVNAYFGSPYLYLGQATDPEGAAITYSLISGPAGMAIDPATGRVTWTPPATGTADASYGVALRAADTLQATTDQAFTLTVHVAPPNRPPLITAQPSVDAVVGKPYASRVSASDPDGDTLTYAVESAPVGFAIDASTGALSWTPEQAGTQAVRLRIEDGKGGVTRHSYTIRVQGVPSTNRPPVFVSTPPTRFQYFGFGDSFQYQLRAIDPDGDPVTYSVRNGLVQWYFPEGTTGSFTVSEQVTAYDGKGGSTVQNFVVQVDPKSEDNDAPVITSPLKVTATVGVPWEYRIEATDPEGQVLRYDLAEQYNGP
ncbi:MAG TPA: putative Ig domain-containing protein, partial [Roseimicrobium sp.]|nr:putative Ig domain-containing protein [Roseimicrobium sp.]